MTFNCIGNGPQLRKAAYWNNFIWGYDSSNTLYQLRLDFAMSSYVIKTQTTSTDAIINMTAIDTGAICSCWEGRQYLEKNNKHSSRHQRRKVEDYHFMGALDPSSFPNLSWPCCRIWNYSRHKDSYSILICGSNYVDTQTQLVPVINQILQGITNFSSPHTIIQYPLVAACRRRSPLPWKTCYIIIIIFGGGWIGGETAERRAGHNIG